MSRSAVDATRFTATSPHAYSKPAAPRSATSNTISPPSATRSQPSTSHPTPGAPTPGTVAPNGAETPKQKVARLRAAHEAAKQRQISRWDTVVVRGRVWADRAHRFTAMGLIGCTGLAAVVTVYALVDMGLHNRRKQKVYYAEQRALLQEMLAAAREAAGRGEADEGQMLLINRERAAEEAALADRKRKEKKVVWDKAKQLLLGGMKKDEEESEERVNDGGELSALGEEGLMKMRDGPDETGAVDAGLQGSVTTETQLNHIGRPRILEAVEAKRREGERALEKKGVEGGPLDKWAQDAVEAGKAEAGKAKRG